MTSRLERIVALLETGSSPAIRQTAAKQLGDITRRFFPAADLTVDPVQEAHQPVTSPHSYARYKYEDGWRNSSALVYRILPFLASKSMDTRLAAVYALNHIAEAVPLWYPELSPTERLSNPDSDNVNVAVGAIQALDIEAVIKSGNKLGTGNETSMANGHPDSTRRRHVQGTDDPAFLENMGINPAFVPKSESLSDLDVDDEVGTKMKPEISSARRKPNPKRRANAASPVETADAAGLSRKRIKLESAIDPVKLEENLAPSLDAMQPYRAKRLGRPRGSKTKAPSSCFPSSPSEKASTAKDDDIFLGLSGRQVLVLKRKLKTNSITREQAADEASKMRLGGDAVSVPASPRGSHSPNGSRVTVATPVHIQDCPSAVEGEETKSEVEGGSGKQSPVGITSSDNKSPAMDRFLEVDLSRSIWTPIIQFLVEQLRHEAWESRHGSSLALNELIRLHGESYGMEDNLSEAQSRQSRERCLGSVATALLEMLALDRFGDFVGDQVVAPVREAGSQALASLMRHLSLPSIAAIHSSLLHMVIQEWSTTKSTGSKIAKGGHIWEMRHAGLLGLKYELAVRPDLITGGTQTASNVELEAYVKGVLRASLLGLADIDDDVRAVAAACLLPVAEAISARLAVDDLRNLLEVLWNTFLEESDELDSSIASVMELLSRLLATPKVIDFYAGEGANAQSLQQLIPRLYPFFRHTISMVRMSVVRTISTFLCENRLPRDWLAPQAMHLIFRNILLEERPDIRDLSNQAWSHALRVVETSGLYGSCVEPYIQEWFNLALIPTIDGYAPLSFANADIGFRRTLDAHDIDKKIMASDFSLIDEDLVFRNRMDAVAALAQIARLGHANITFTNLLSSFLMSTSSHQLTLCGVFLQEWAQIGRGVTEEEAFLANRLSESGRLVSALANLTEREAPEAYYEVMKDLATIKQETRSIRLVIESAPSSKSSRRPETEAENISLADIKRFLSSTFDVLLQMSSRRAAMRQQLADRKTGLETALSQFERLKTKLDNRVATSAAAALVWMRVTPSRLNPIIQNVMKGIKNEKNADMQIRAAKALAIFIDSCLDPKTSLPANPVAKIINNLASLICSDPIRTPAFLEFPSASGIYVLEEERKRVESKKAAIKAAQTAGVAFDDGKDDLACASDGAERAFAALCDLFQDDIFDKLPQLFDIVASPLSGRQDFSHLSSQEGQDIINSLAVLQILLPHLAAGVHERISALFPSILSVLCSPHAILRNCAAKTFATACKVMPSLGMLFAIEKLVPLLGDAVNEVNRCGGIEAIFYIVQRLEIKVLPYILFMVIPVLGRMTDSLTDIRLVATNIFATLVKLIPLEEGIPDPEGLPSSMLTQRETEREFLQQLLNNRKVEPYEMPVTVRAELRPYQRDGVSWLAFLAKYQLHGILCDDMGLGKSIQTICIIASKHQERRVRFAASGSSDARAIPSLIVCPPTLIGHWYHEISKFVDDLKPFKYFGSTKEREGLRRQIAQHDVVITSYEVIRSDIDALKQMPFLYCVLDEGHTIKNGKSKLSMAVKALQSNHRLILSGTPIQNNVLELWNLFDFLMPGFLGSEKQFNDKFSKPILANRDGKTSARQSEAATLALDALHKQVLPFLLRRLKEDVLDDLPPKIIQDYYCDLSSVQRLLYEEFHASRAAKETQEVIASGNIDDDVAEPQRHVFQTLQFLRKLCNHPLLALNQDTALYRRKVQEAWLKDKEHTPKDPNDLAHCPKLVALQQLLLDCGIGHDSGDTVDSADIDATANHRVLIFAQTKQMLDVIQNELFTRLMPTVSFMRLDGSTEALGRHDIVQTFNNDPSIDVLLLTTSVGGLGLTLTGADTVIFMDHDWNPMKDAQAMDRAHRIGQKKVVNVYRLITRGTLEEKIMSLQKFKLNIANTVVNEQNSGLESMNTDQVLDLFNADSGEAESRGRPHSGGASAKNQVLEGLHDLPAVEEYENLSLDNFLSKY